MREIIFTIEGEPVAKGRPRFTRAGGFARTYTPQKTRDAEAKIAILARCALQQQKSDDVALQQKNPIKNQKFPIKVELNFFLKIPKSISQKKLNEGIKPTVKPDLDNFAKTVLDAMNGIVYEDDSQVVEIILKKEYSDHPRTEVRVSPI